MHSHEFARASCTHECVCRVKQRWWDEDNDNMSGPSHALAALAHIIIIPTGARAIAYTHGRPFNFPSLNASVFTRRKVWLLLPSNFTLFVSASRFLLSLSMDLLVLIDSFLRGRGRETSALLWVENSSFLLAFWCEYIFWWFFSICLVELLMQLQKKL